MVGNLIQHITNNTLSTIDRTYLDFEEANEGDVASWDSWELDEIKLKQPVTIRSTKSGYLQNVDIPDLIQAAIHDDFIIKLERDIGEYVDEGTVILFLLAICKEARPNKAFKCPFPWNGTHH